MTVLDRGSHVIAAYAYDALSRRVKVDESSTLTDLYYSSAWQVLEERVGGTPTARYVWSPVYIDCLVLRDNIGASERHYAQQDANYNTTSLANPGGSIVERYAYTPFGTVTYFDPSWTPQSASSYDWIYLHQGGRLDGVSGLYNFRYRDYSTSLGRWMTNDKSGYSASGMNLYWSRNNNPVIYTDFTGNQAANPFDIDKWEKIQFIAGAIKAGTLTPVAAMDKKTFTAKGCLGKNQCDVSFTFNKAYSGTRFAPQWNNAPAQGLYINLSANFDRTKCCGCDQVNIIQIVKNYRVINGQVQTVINKDWRIDSDKKTPYFIDGTNGVVGTGGNAAVSVDAPAVEIAANNAHLNYGAAFYSCAVCINKSQKDKVMACVSWGYYIDDKGVLSLIPNPPVASCGAPAPKINGKVEEQFKIAADAWNADKNHTTLDWE